MFVWELASEPFNHLLSFAEAAEIWGIDQSTLRKAVANKKLLEGRDCRKFGKQWVVTVDAMIREYGGRIKWANFAEENRIQESQQMDLSKAKENPAENFLIP